MMLYLRLALKEIIKNRKFSLFFIINMAVGLTGFIVISAFSTSFNRHIEGNLKEILTADFMIMSNRPLNEKEIQITNDALGDERRESEQITFYSMVRGKKHSRLSIIVALDRNFPLYGRFHRNQKDKKAVNESLQKEPLALLERDTALFLGVKEGDLLRIGNRDFKVSGFVNDSERSLTAVEFAPKIFIGLKQLEGTGLLGYGSRARYIRFFSYEEGTDIKAVVKRLTSVYDSFYKGEPQISIVDKSGVGRRIERFIGNFTGYLGLIATAALFLAGIATAYLFRGYLNLKLKEISILMSIGATRFEACSIFTIQLVFLGFLSSLLSIFLSLFVIPAFPIILKGVMPSDLKLSIDLFTILTAFSTGIFGSIIFCLPVIARIYSVKPVTLLKELKKNNGGLLVKISTIACFIPALLAFFLISSTLLNSYKSGSFFTLAFIIVTAFFALFGWLIFNGCSYLSKKGSFTFKISMRNLYRNKLSSVSCFVTISMGVFLISLIPQIQSGIVNEIESPEGLKIPSLFLIDIQEEQVKGIKEFLSSNNLDLSYLSPVVNGRILSVNGEGFVKRKDERDRKKEREKRRFRRTEYMFSARDQLGESENIVEGKPLSMDTWNWEGNEPFEISLAQRFAGRNDLKIGDIMEFEIQGIPLKGKVVNFRKVRWNSFQPNFFILFQKGVLENAPKTYLASIMGVKPSVKTVLKNRLFDKFPNVSVLDVTKTIEQILSITEKLSLSIKFMAYLAIIAGLVSIYSIARNEANRHKKEINLLKVLGAGFKDLRIISGLEFGFIGLFASIFAVFLSILFSYVVSYYFFDRLWAFRIDYSIFIMAATTIICFLTALFATESVVREKPVLLLGEG